MSSSFASATGISDAPPHKRFNCVIQSGAAIVSPAPDLFDIAASSLRSAKTMLSKSSSVNVSGSSIARTTVATRARLHIVVDVPFVRARARADASSARAPRTSSDACVRALTHRARAHALRVARDALARDDVVDEAFARARSMISRARACGRRACAPVGSLRDV